MDIKDVQVGMRVVVRDNEMHYHNHRFYPPVGTIGEVTEVRGPGAWVTWPEDTVAINGTRKSPTWHIPAYHIDPAEAPENA